MERLSLTGFPRASYKRRLVSFYFDVWFFLWFAAFVAGAFLSSDVQGAGDWAFLVACVLYWVGFVALGVTPASWLFDLRIVDDHDRAPGLWRAFRRSLIPGTVWAIVTKSAYLFDQRIDAAYESNPSIQDGIGSAGLLALLLYCMVYLIGARWSRHDRALHDVIAGTRVIARRGPRKAEFARSIERRAATFHNWSETHVRGSLGRWIDRKRMAGTNS